MNNIIKNGSYDPVARAARVARCTTTASNPRSRLKDKSQPFSHLHQYRC